MRLIPIASLCAALVLCTAGAPIPSYAQLSPNAIAFASDLAGPRALKAGPGGDLYVAEAGLEGPLAASKICASGIFCQT
jgi:hypothetical protein